MSPPVDRPELEAGYVLHQRAYRDSSLIVDVFTREAGRLALVARGARRPRARQRALLQAFRPLRLSWRLGGEMGTLTAVESDGQALNLSGERLLSAFYLNELILRLAGRHDPHPVLYDTYSSALSALSRHAEDNSDEGALGSRNEASLTAVILRRFEREALECLGYGLPLDDNCVDGSPIRAEGRYRFDAQAGAYSLADAHNRDQERGVSGRALLALMHDDWSDPSVLPDIRRLLAAALSPHLGGRPLKTARVLRDLRRRQGRSGENES
ncbi:DNA repair protein RecO (recombination protein O) [Natronospira proteinivora]|uniref:DNA repair protein RecO n=1 Tax=Natronospira proteinivora TaxID=1807133 RepID=A0ABT1G5V2_9GAMM|nr:DNA repair protein RecO [Natronospira proteinivora]MCP1726679.1 DNA repair protein RecO (recombination protein O) [Natronospira proteinivora]